MYSLYIKHLGHNLSSYDFKLSNKYNILPTIFWKIEHRWQRLKHQYKRNILQIQIQRLKHLPQNLKTTFKTSSPKSKDNISNIFLKILRRQLNNLPQKSKTTFKTSSPKSSFRGLFWKRSFTGDVWIEEVFQARFSLKSRLSLWEVGKGEHWI